MPHESPCNARAMGNSSWLDDERSAVRLELALLELQVGEVR